MWTLFNTGVASLELAFVAALLVAALHRLRQRLFVTRLRIPSFLVTLGMLLVVRGTALYITDGFPQRTWNAGGHWLRQRAGRRLLHRPAPGLHVAVLVHRARRVVLGYVLTQTKAGQLDPGLGRQRQRGPRPRRATSAGPRSCLFMLTSVMAALRRHHQLDPHLGRQPQQRHRLRARGDRDGGDRRHGADAAVAARSSGRCSASSSCA